MSDAIRVQVEVTVDVPRGLEVTQELMVAALNAWIDGKDLPKGFKVLAIHWDGATRGHATTPRKIDQVARRLLSRVPFVFQTVRNR